MRPEQFGDEAVIRKYQRQSDSGYTMNQSKPHRLTGVNAFLKPETKSIEAPRRRPAHQRLKDESIKQRPSGSEAGAIVIPGKELNTFGYGNVFPVATALANDGTLIGGAELQRRTPAAVRKVSFTDALTLASDLHAETDARGVAETLWIFFTRAGKVINLGKAKVPALMKLWRLRVFPEFVHRGM